MLGTLTVTVALPEPPEMLVRLRVAVGPGGLTLTLSVTSPVNPELGLIVIVEVSEFPSLIDRELVLSEAPKSPGPADVTVTTITVWWTVSPLDPYTVTSNVPAACAVSVRVALFDSPDARVTDERLSDAVKPVDNP